MLVHGDHRKGDEPAFRARLSGLCQILELTADDAARSVLIGDDPEIRGNLAGRIEETDLLKVADVVRKETHVHRRGHEDELERLDRRRAEVEGRRLQALRGAFGEEIDLEELGRRLAGLPPSGPLAGECEAAVLALASLEQGRAAAIAEEARRSALREKFAKAPPATDAAEAELEDANAAVAAKAKELATARDAVAELRERLRNAEAMVARIDQEHANAGVAQETARQRLADLRTQRRAYDEAQAELAEEVVGPDEDRIAAAREVVEQAQRRLAIARARDEDASLAAEQERISREMSAARDAIAHYESESLAVWERLAAWLNERLDSDRIRVCGDAIEAHVDGQWVDIAGERISEGQRDERVYSMLLERREGNRLILIDGTTSLDAERRRRVGDLARSRGIAVVVEAPSDDESWTWEHY
jgi:hypothetical protein